MLAFGAVLYSAPWLSDALDEHGGWIQPGVTAGGVELGGMKRGEAEEALRQAADFAGTPVVIALPVADLILRPEDTGAKLDVHAVIAQAYQYGRGGDVQAVDWSPFLTLKEDVIRAAVEDYAAQLKIMETPNTSVLSGSIPALDELHFDAAAESPSVIFTVGQTGFDVDTDGLTAHILEAYKNGCFTLSGEDFVTERPAAPFDLAAVREQFETVPVNTTLDRVSGQLIPGAYGMTMDMEAAAEQLANAEKGAQITVPMHYAAPEVLGQEAYFQDILGACETPHNTNEKRNTNLRLACEALNGIVLQPGDVISYNATLGQRTADKGYKAAPAYSGTELVDTLGGGICQVSSTLYLCSLYAELETVSRVNHGYPASYMPVGLDATVSWGRPDLKICNNTEYPVKLLAEDAEGFVRVWIMGTETREHYVRMGFIGSGDGYSRSDIIRYDRATGEELSRETYCYSSYLSSAWTPSGEIGQNEAWIGGKVQQQEPFYPTEETRLAAMNYSQPNRCQDEIR